MRDIDVGAGEGCGRCTADWDGELANGEGEVTFFEGPAAVGSYKCQVGGRDGESHFARLARHKREFGESAQSFVVGYYRGHVVRREDRKSVV